MELEKALKLTYQGEPLGHSSDDFGGLRASNDAIDDRDELHRRMTENGYLFLKNHLNKDEVLAARQEVMDRLMGAGVLDERYPAINGIAASKKKIDGRATGSFMPLLARNNPPLDKVIHEGRSCRFSTSFSTDLRATLTTPGFEPNSPDCTPPPIRTATSSIWAAEQKTSTPPGYPMAMCPPTWAD